MTAVILSPGIQATLQGAPRCGWRHMGVPSAGPADPWSMALANRLVRNAAEATTIEITGGGFRALFTEDVVIALTGAATALTVDGTDAPAHETIILPKDRIISIAPPKVGARSYLAIYGGWVGATVLGSVSTYVPAGFGGHDGRALMAGDRLEYRPHRGIAEIRRTPIEYRPFLSTHTTLRAYPSAEAESLSKRAREALFGVSFRVTPQATRMGLPLEGEKLQVMSDGKMISTPVFPGTVQCPESGQPIILSADAQTTGGYPRIAQVARADRHAIGQLAPGATVRFLERDMISARQDLAEKTAFLRKWVPDFSLR